MHAAAEIERIEELYGCICEAAVGTGPRGGTGMRHIHEDSNATYVQWRDAGQSRAGLLYNENNRMNNDCRYALLCY